VAQLRLRLGILLLLSLTVAPVAARAASVYADIDEHALSIPIFSVTSVEQLAADLTAPARDDREAARAIFRWIAANITYDMPAHRAGSIGNSDPESVLLSGCAVCEGYARLFEALARAAGFQVVTIHGHGKDANYHVGDDVSKSDHTWNAVKIDGRWQLLDVTWAAGYLTKSGWTRRFDDFFFLTPAEQFINGHFPNDPRWQLLREPISREQYRRLVRLRPAFHRLGMKLESHQEGIIAAGKQVTITFTGPEGLALAAALQGEDTPDEDCSWTRCQGQGRKYLVHVQWPRPGRYELVIYGKRRGDPGLARGAASYLIEASEGVGRAGAFPCTYDPFDRLGLKLDTRAAGRIRARGALEVTLGGPAGLQLWAALKTSDGGELDRRWTLCQRQDGKYQVRARWPEAGQYTLVVYAGLVEATGPFPAVVTYHIDATGSALMFPRTYNEFAQFGASIRSPLDGLLGAGLTERFDVHVPGAATVAVGQNGEMIRLDQQGSDFTGDITPGAGELVLIVDGRVVASYDAE
jgi:transglutaminase-like putative cysteine protease